MGLRRAHSIQLTLASLLLLATLLFVPPSVKAGTSVSGDVIGTWDMEGSPYTVEADVIVGGAFWTVTDAEVAGPSLAVPSETESRSESWSPLSPLPAPERSRLAPVRPGRSTPCGQPWCGEWISRRRG